MLEAVCFDLDGTLFDDRQYIEAGLRSAAAELERITGVALESEILHAYFDRGITEGTFDAVLEEHDLSQELVPQLVDAYHDHDAELTPYPGVVDTLETLDETYELGLITGGRNGREKLDRLGLAEYFEAVVVTDDRPYSKYDPDPFEAVCEAFGVATAEAAYVGDRPSLDFPQANRLGMYTVRVETGRYATVDATADERPDAKIGTLEALPELLDDLD